MARHFPIMTLTDEEVATHINEFVSEMRSDDYGEDMRRMVDTFGPDVKAEDLDEQYLRDAANWLCWYYQEAMEHGEDWSCEVMSNWISDMTIQVWWWRNN